MTSVATAEALDSIRNRRSRISGAVLINTPDAEAVVTTPLQSNSVVITDAVVVGDSYAGRISSCPMFERLRATAKNDREEFYLKRQQEVKRAKELCQRRALVSENISMDEYYTTLFRPSPPGNAAAATAALPLQVPPLRQRDMLLKDLESTFVACYYRMNPEALERRKEEDEAAERRRRSTRVASERMSRSEGTQRSHSFSPQKKSKKRKVKKERRVVPVEGAPAVNLRLLEAALVDAADSKGLLTREALTAALTPMPFEVRDEDALESLFFIVRALSTASDALDSEPDRRLEASFSTSIPVVRAAPPRGSLQVSSAQVT
ncbi:hypothetical protein DQ04_10991000, partial [Trypanosoma grayi]|uniref:hypothetical protein n=1 Tax=Trypanosoma grayi TaxID=71804 RepID=UPI0004F40B8B